MDAGSRGPSLVALYARFYLAQIAGFFLNPRCLAQVLQQSVGQISSLVRWLTRPLTRKVAPHPLDLPFQGRWKALNGGVHQAESHSWGLIEQRYAYDFVKVDADGKTHAGTGRRPEDYFAFGEPILAPAAGVVRVVRDGIRDFPDCGRGWTDWRAPDLGGNHVLLEHDGGVYTYLAHLQCGSVAVRVGAQVTRGQLLGRCGNSGNSTEPHLHLHVQDGPRAFFSVGLPIAFTAFSADRARHALAVPEDCIGKNDVVWADPNRTPVTSPRAPELRAADLFPVLLMAGGTLFGVFAVARAVVQLGARMLAQ